MVYVSDVGANMAAGLFPAEVDKLSVTRMRRNVSMIFLALYFSWGRLVLSLLFFVSMALGSFHETLQVFYITHRQH